MKKELAMPAIKQPVLFLDDWPQPPMAYEEEDEKPGLTDVKKWRLQMLLAVNPWGIPSLGFLEAYKRMFRCDLNIRDLGFEHLSDMVSSLKDVFTIQEPDDVTALMFPDYPHDRILHDARVGHNFGLNEALDGPDPETLNTYAWINRDENFPTDVVLAGEQYSEVILPMTEASITGTRGIHQAVLVGAASPEHFYINIKSDSLDKVSSLSGEVSQYFKECGFPPEMYSVPDEFIYRGFPCLVYIELEDAWERCEIIGRSPKGNKILVETVDYGGTHTVNQICLYLIPRVFFDFPKQGVLVSMIGLKPANGANKWPAHVGSRIRCFSNKQYYLNCLLIGPPKKVAQQPQSLEKSTSQANSLDSTGTSEKSSGTEQPRRRRKKWKRKPQFEVIVCDRNDDEMDIYLDEVLLLETYAIGDETRVEEVAKYKQLLKEVFPTIPRPKNPLLQEVVEDSSSGTVPLENIPTIDDAPPAAA